MRRFVFAFSALLASGQAAPAEEWTFARLDEIARTRTRAVDHPQRTAARSSSAGCIWLKPTLPRDTGTRMLLEIRMVGDRW